MGAEGRGRRGSEVFVAKPSEKDLEYIDRIRAMEWPELYGLWEEITSGNTPGWGDGKALEHLVVRAFELGDLEVEYPYHVPPAGNPLEQIDGIIYLPHHIYLMECKDEKATDIEAIAKLRNQLMRRPDTTLRCVFTKDHFTLPAIIVADFATPQRILLWSKVDIEGGLRNRNFAGVLQDKYRQLCKYGLTDHSPYYSELEV
jgi:hypothetical protein